MTNVDDRIVRMEFDNERFEKNIKTTQNSLDRLKSKLNFSSAVSSMSELQRSSNSFSMNGLTSAVNTVADRFTNMGIVGMTVLTNITNSAVNAGKQMLRALTVDPVKTGLQEYETKMNAIQTILTNTKSKGTTLDDVTATLDELNTYADKTIYNFAEMTRNIGTFTAAGVDLKTSALAIKGIANLAAGSGSNAQQASTAMYQLSQALAAGTVKLMDWNSVVNAGMGGELFQNALRDTAEEMGIVVDRTKNFRETLQTGWLTSDVLIGTLSKFADESTELGKDLTKAATEVKTFTQLTDTMKESVQSGWAKTWEYIIGDKAQAAELFTSINDWFTNVASAAEESRNAMLEFWNVHGGRKALIDGLTSSFAKLGTIIKPIGKAFREVFPPASISTLDTLSVKFKYFIDGIKVSRKTVNDIKDTFKGLFSILNIVKKAVSGMMSSISPIGSVFANIVGHVLDATAAIGRFFTGLDEATNKTDFFSESIHNLFTWLGGNAEQAFSSMMSGIKTIFQSISNFISTHIGKVKDTLSNTVSKFSITDLLGIATAGGIMSVASKFSGIFDSIGDTLESFQNKVRTRNLISIASAIGILAGSFLLLSTVKPEKIATAFAGMMASVGTLLAGIYGLSKVLGAIDFKSFSKVNRAMISLALSTFILSGSMKILSTISWNGIAKGLVSISAMLMVMAATVKSLDGIRGSFGRISAGFISLSIAIIGMSAAVKILSNIDIAGLLKGVGAIASILLVITGFSAIMSKNKLKASSAGLIGIAASMIIFSGAIKMLGSLSIEQLVKGITGMAVALYAVAGASHLMKGTLGGAASLVVMSAGILVLTSAILALSAVKPDKLGKAILVLVGALAVLGIAGALLGPVAPAMLAVAGAVALLGVGTFAAGAGVMALGIGITTLSAALITGAAGIVGGLTTIVAGLVTILPIGATALAAAITLFVVSLANGATDIANAATKLVIALVSALAKAIPQLVTLGLEFVVALLIGISDNIGQIVTAGVSLISNLIIGIANAIPMVVSAGIYLVVTFINSVANGIRDNSVAVMAAVQNLVSSIVEFALTALQTLVSMIPVVGDNMASGLEKVKNKVRDTLAPESMAQIGAEAMQGIEQGFTNKSELLLEQGEAGVDAYMSGASGELHKVRSVGENIGTEGAKGAGSKTNDFKLSGKYGGQGFINGMDSKLLEAYNSGAALADSAKRGLNDRLEIASPSKAMKQSGKFGGEGFIIGLSSYIDKSKTAGKSIGKASLDGVITAMDTINSILNGGVSSPVITPVIDLTKVKQGTRHIKSIISNSNVHEIMSDNKVHDISENSSNRNATFSFVQNNYSPKALSRTEIYRQTRNQLSAAKGAIKA